MQKPRRGIEVRVDGLPDFVASFVPGPRSPNDGKLERKAQKMRQERSTTAKFACTGLVPKMCYCIILFNTRLLAPSIALLSVVCDMPAHTFMGMFPQIPDLA